MARVVKEESLSKAFHNFRNMFCKPCSFSGPQVDPMLRMWMNQGETVSSSIALFTQFILFERLVFFKLWFDMPIFTLVDHDGHTFRARSSALDTTERLFINLPMKKGTIYYYSILFSQLEGDFMWYHMPSVKVGVGLIAQESSTEHVTDQQLPIYNATTGHWIGIICDRCSEKITVWRSGEKMTYPIQHEKMLNGVLYPVVSLNRGKQVMSVLPWDGNPEMLNL